jgi:hypothetical protein
MTRFSDRIEKLFAAVAHSRFWHKADMPRCLLYVRFRGDSVAKVGRVARLGTFFEF